MVVEHWGFILALFQSKTANKIDSEPTQDYKRLPWYAKLKYYELQEKNWSFLIFLFWFLTIFG